MPKGFVTFFGASGVFDCEVFCEILQEGETHGDAVVFVGVDFDVRVEVSVWCAVDGDGGFCGGGFDSEAVEFGFEGVKAVGFFDAEVFDIGDFGFAVGESGEDGEGHHEVGAVVHGDFAERFEGFGALNGGAGCGFGCAAAHFS